MSKEFDNTNRGVLFKNAEKTPDKPNWSDYRGNLNVDGQEFYLDAWIKKSKDGKTFMSLSVKPKGERASKPKPEAPEFSDTIPF
jgi:hypothetical protein